MYHSGLFVTPLFTLYLFPIIYMAPSIVCQVGQIFSRPPTFLKLPLALSVRVLGISVYV